MSENELNQFVEDMEKAYDNVVRMNLHPFERFVELTRELYKMGYRKMVVGGKKYENNRGK